MTQQGGGVSPSSKTVKLGDNYGDLPTPTRTGYSFIGWQTTDGTDVTSTTQNTTIGDHTLTANWSANNYTLTLYDNKNILNGGELTTTQDLNSWGGSSNASIVTEDGIVCARMSNEIGSQKNFSQGILDKILFNTEYICSIKTKVINYTPGPSEPYLGVHMNGYYNNNGSSSWFAPGESKLLEEYSGQGWQNIYYHFISNSSVSASTATQANIMIYMRDCAGDIFFRNFSLALATNITKSVKYSSNSGRVSPLTYSGFTFNGYYTQPVGGVKIYNADGSLVKGVAGYTDSSGAWIKADNVKLYAQWAENNYTLTLYDNKNILNGGELTTTQDLYSWGGSSNASIVTEDGIVCARMSNEIGSQKNFSQGILDKILFNTEYICSIKTKVINYTPGPSEPYLGVHMNGYYNNNGSSSWFAPGESKLLEEYSGQGWQNIYYHFISNSSVSASTATQANIMIYMRDCAGDIFFRNFSLALATNITKSVKYSSNSGRVSPLTYSGFTFNGYYTQPVGGVKIYNADGSLVKGVAGYTDSSGAWIRAADARLYGQWTQN
ncbi:MAG: InlB B-repeat-containing protein [Christensenellales bacterium]